MPSAGLSAGHRRLELRGLNQSRALKHILAPRSSDVSDTICFERMLSGGPACFPDCCGNSSHEGALPASPQQPELRSTVVQNLQSCMRNPLGFMGPAYGSRAFRGSLLCLNASCRLSRLTRMICFSTCHLSQHCLQGAHQPQGSLQTLTQDHPRHEAIPGDSGKLGGSQSNPTYAYKSP